MMSFVEIQNKLKKSLNGVLKGIPNRNFSKAEMNCIIGDCISKDPDLRDSIEEVEIYDIKNLVVGQVELNISIKPFGREFFMAGSEISLDNSKDECLKMVEDIIGE